MPAPRFHLEHALSAWRRSLEHNRAFTADDLEELERHVRDQVEAAVSRGGVEEAAFRRAVREIGGYGDVEAEYQKVYWGKLKLRRQVIQEIQWRFSMLLNDLKVALRTLRKQKLFSFINVAGLGIGIAAGLLILQYASFELGYDAFHEHAPDLYRLTNDRYQNGALTQHGVITYPSVAKAMQADYPEVLNNARVITMGQRFIRRGDLGFEELNLMSADSAFLSMFTFPLIEGDPRTALARPWSILLSERQAEKYFGTGWRGASILGQTLTLDNRFDMTVTGVFEDVPPNSHMRFDLLLSYATLAELFGPAAEDSWTNSNFWAYLQLAPGTDPAALERKFEDFSTRYFEGTRVTGSEEVFHLQPLKGTHLYSDYEYELWAHGDGTSVWSMLVIAGFILLIAWVNYVNLSTARALERAREVGVRKVVGAGRLHLLRQFLAEAAVLNGLGVAAAVAVAYGVRPLLGRWLGVTFAGAVLPDGWGWGLAALFMVGVLVSGLYPALMLSSFDPVSVLKGQLTRLGRAAVVRKGLVVVQFALSFGLIAGTFAVYRQVQAMKAQDLGMNIDQMLVLQGPRLSAFDSTYFANIGAFKDEVRRIPGVRHATASQRLPGTRTGRIFGIQRLGAGSEVQYTTSEIGVDHDYFEAFEMEVLAGRGFEASDHRLAFAEVSTIVLNASAVRHLGFESPERAVHERLRFYGKDWEVVGVVADHNQQSVKVAREPIIFLPVYSSGNYFFLKVAPQGVEQTLAAVEEAYRALFPGNAFSSFFLDTAFDAQYASDGRFRNLFSLFAGLGIMLACLGLFGLSVLTMARRTKEVGVRKVLGASVPGLLGLLTLDFVKLVGVAVLAACPPTYLALARWLDGYPYHIDLGWTLFVLPALFMLVIAVGTVGVQTLKAARANPVQSLRYE